MVTEDERKENDIEALSNKLESLGIEKTCQVVRILLRRGDLDVIALGRVIFDVDLSWSGEVGWNEKHA